MSPMFYLSLTVLCVIGYFSPYSLKPGLRPRPLFYPMLAVIAGLLYLVASAASADSVVWSTYVQRLPGPASGANAEQTLWVMAFIGSAVIFAFWVIAGFVMKLSFDGKAVLEKAA